MTEIDLLRLITWCSVLGGILSIFVTVIPIAAANGTRPLLLAFATMSIATFIGSLFLLFITYGIDQINSTGMAEVGVFYLRIKPGFLSIILIWLGLRYWRQPRHH